MSLSRRRTPKSLGFQLRENVQRLKCRVPGSNMEDNPFLNLSFFLWPIGDCNDAKARWQKEWFGYDIVVLNRNFNSLGLLLSKVQEQQSRPARTTSPFQ